MKAQVITTEYTGLCPVQPWQHVVAAAQGSAMDARPSPCRRLAEAAVAGPRKARDRGASAVEWVIITGIVVAIVAGVGVIISKAIPDKADDACNQINSAGANGRDAGTGGGNGGTGGGGCNDEVKAGRG